MFSDRKGNRQKPPQTKLSRQKTPDKNPREQLRENLYRGILSGFFVLGLLKVGGPSCVTYFWGVPGCVTKCDRGRGLKLAKNSVTYFMGGPHGYVRGERSRGRQRKRWMDNVREDLYERRIQLSMTYGKTKNREVWRNIIRTSRLFFRP